MTAVVLAGSSAVSLDDNVRAALSKARELDEDAIAVVFGEPDAAMLDQMARCGAARAVLFRGADAADASARLQALAIAGLAERETPALILAPTSSHTIEVMGALSVRLGAGILWGLTDIVRRDGVLVGRRPIHNDTEIAEFAWRGEPSLALLRPSALSPIERPATALAVEELPFDLPEIAHARVVSRTSTDGGAGRSLADADVIVAGGRGLEKRENLEWIEELAGLLGGVPAVSLPLVEAGWAPRSMQVGQTGTIVKPRVYIACGISGQIQHRIGMEGSEVIVAINSDASAPVMDYCDVGVVGDVKDVLPRLIEAITQRRPA